MDVSCTFNTMQCILVDLRCVTSMAACHRLIYWDEACTKLDVGPLANCWGASFLRHLLVFPLWDGCWSGWVNALPVYGRSHPVLVLKCILLKTHVYLCCLTQPFSCV